MCQVKMCTVCYETIASMLWKLAGGWWSIKWHLVWQGSGDPDVIWCEISELVITWTVSWIASDIRSLDDIQCGLLYQMLVVWIIVDRVELRGSGIIPSEAVMHTHSRIGTLVLWCSMFEQTVVPLWRCVWFRRNHLNWGRVWGCWAQKENEKK